MSESPIHQRLLSLDLFRGLIMFLLVAETTHLYGALDTAFEGSGFLSAIFLQFHHHPWNGLRFWDLIQPGFMFIVGVAMAYSIQKRWDAGMTWAGTFKHIVYRCAMLLAFGVGLHCVYSGELVWELWNVLSQLSFTILVAFLLFKLPARAQLAVSVGLLLLTEILYRTVLVDGYNQPFVQGQNFGAWMDMVLMGKINGGGWVAVNALPTAAHTIWGVLAGKVLRDNKPAGVKLKTLVIAGLVALVIGFGLDWTGITPIIKRIATTSFVFASAGWCLLALALFYWIVDVRGNTKGVWFFVVMGTSPIFIYLFSQVAGSRWLNDIVGIFSNGLMSWVGIPDAAMHVVTALCILAVYWYVCYWLYKREIVIKI